ncbi:MAG TPA: FecR family protein [Devosia sp.]|jgi:uncharacterized membrane protein YgcG|uniref:FecR family protein n=1 Tax=Devosia sp. TaxID=1871048 RepID=UPI002F936686
MLKYSAQVALFAMLVLPCYGQGWTVDRVRGTAEQLDGGRWVTLIRGAVIVDDQMVRTGSDGRVGLIRGLERVELAPGTEIRLHEGEGKLTSFEQSSGSLTADVERKNVQHFSVQTPFLAAVVKGTRFQVTVGSNAAQVTVDRGTVQVQDTENDLVVDLRPGQEAQVTSTEPLLVSGSGPVAVFTFEGQRVVNGTEDVPADETGGPAEAAQDTAASPAAGPSNNAAAQALNNSNAVGKGNNGQGNGNSGGKGNSGNGNSGGGNSSHGNGSQGNGNSHSGNSNSGSNGNSGQGNGNGNGNSGSGNSGQGNSGQGNGNSGSNGNAGGNGNGGNGNSGSNGNGNGGNGHGGGNDNASGNSNAGGNGNGNSGGQGNGGNGNGGGNSDNGGGNGSGKGGRND